MSITIPLDRRAPARVALAVLRHSGWFVAIVVAIAGGLLLCAVTASDVNLAGLAGGFTLHALVGLVGSFALHEAAHTGALRRAAPGIRSITLTLTGLRMSLTPAGTIVGKQIAFVALMGPLLTAAAGAVLWATVPDLRLHLWFIGHVVFLAPCFGDGRAIITGARRWSSSVEL
ncbi:hypothetical protein [Leifsonia sp. LS-T14]|uniref:hypothetical protein n=1 Tax=unclassified Leifsonia TaxID=2663824 RepID=UPI0035A65B0E